MRGWSGNGPFFLKAVQVKDTEKISTKVILHFEKIDYQINELGEIGNLFLQLPIYIYRKGGFQPSSCVNDGFTIGQRFDIIRHGERAVTTENGSIQENIRISSNWICSSVHRYMTILGMKEPFNINELVEIF